MLKSLSYAVALLTMGACATSNAPDSIDTAVPKMERKGMVSHPSALSFDEVTFEIPAAADYRYELDNNNVAYIVADASLPLIQLTVMSPLGSFLVDPERAGLAGMTSAMLRQGGTRDLGADEIDERLDFLATEIDFSIGSASSSASLDTLTTNLDESLDLMFDMLTEPRFDAGRLTVNRDRAVESMRRRNDDTRSIEPRFWSELQYGDDFFLNERSTQRSVERLDAEAMRALARRVFASGNLVIAASGAVDPEMLVAKLNEQLGRLNQSAESASVPNDVSPAEPGLYGVDKDDVNQTRVSIGHPGLMSGHPDEFALRVANFVLGGGGFTSRIMQRVRSDEGLAYSAGSSYQFGVYFPGQFRAYLQSKNRSVAEAIGIVLEEINTIRTEPIPADVLNTAKQGTVAYLADIFDSPSGRARRFASDHMTGRDPSYWTSFEENVLSVTAEDVMRATQEHLRPDDLRFLVVGKLEETLAGDGEHGSLEEVVGQTLRRLKLRDPLTNETL